MNHRVLLAWELGGGHGHLAPLTTLARHLRRHGHRLIWAVRDTAATARLLADDPAAAADELHPAPLPGAAPNAPRVQLNYASLLFTCGWYDPQVLTQGLHAWRDRMQQSRCTRVIADHAPTALLAAHSLNLPCGHLGTGFTVPPPTTPFPAWLPGVDTALLHRNEALVTAVANQALASCGGPALPHLQALLDRSYPGVCTYPETDHHPPPRPSAYLGLPDSSRGVEVRWAVSGGPRVVAVLAPQAGLAPVLTALAKTPAQVLVRVRDLPLDRLAPLARPGLAVVDQPVHLRRALESADAFVGTGAHGAAVEALLAGKPLLLLPDTRERALLADRLVQLGAAIHLPAGQRGRFPQALQQLLEDPRLRDAARAFAARYRGLRRTDILSRWATRFFAHA